LLSGHALPPTLGSESERRRSDGNAVAGPSIVRPMLSCAKGELEFLGRRALGRRRCHSVVSSW
jgi:hypothetical protein